MSYESNFQFHSSLNDTPKHYLISLKHSEYSPDSKVHGANMGPIWGRQDPGGPHVGPINFAIWELLGYVT